MIPYIIGGAAAVIGSLSLPAIGALAGGGLLAADSAGVDVPVLSDLLPSIGPLNSIQTLALAALLGAGAKLAIGD